MSDRYDSSGKMVVSTGFGYEARQLVKRIMDMMYTNYEDLQTAYKAFQDVFAEKVCENPSNTEPSAYRWVGGEASPSDSTPTTDIRSRLEKLTKPTPITR